MKPDAASAPGGRKPGENPASVLVAELFAQEIQRQPQAFGDVVKGKKVLEIGTGSGYQTCVLLELGAKVFSIERQKELFDKTGPFLQSLGYSPKLFYGDGYKGLPAYGPFDKILVTCGAPFVPQELVDQLKPGGLLVIPVGAGEVQQMQRIRKLQDGSIEQQTLRDFRFVPMLENKNWGD